MSENNNNQNKKNKTDIDELLRDFGRQKDAHRESFGEIEPPKRSKGRAAILILKAPKYHRARKKSAIKQSKKAREKNRQRI